jgi:thiamine biosynthesis protein ThiS
MTQAVTETIEVTINGTPRQMPRDATLLDVLAALGLDPRLVVVEHNWRVVRRQGLGDVRIAPGDAIELVHFVGGG